MRTLAITTAVAALTLVAQPGIACHHYAIWRYPTPQSCRGVVHHYVRTPLVAAPTPPHVERVAGNAAPADARTPDQVLDFDEHYEQLETHKDEINKLMIILHTQENAAKAAGIELR